jgi:hypothetical protein
VWQDAEFCHLRCGCATQIMKTPSLHPVQPFIQLGFGPAPTRPPSTEYKLTVAWLALQDGPDLRGYGKLVLPFILASLGRQHDQASLEVDFTPTQTSDFVSALCGQHKQPDNVTELVWPKCIHHGPKLGLG